MAAFFFFFWNIIERSLILKSFPSTAVEVKPRRCIRSVLESSYSSLQWHAELLSLVHFKMHWTLPTGAEAFLLFFLKLCSRGGCRWCRQSFKEMHFSFLLRRFLPSEKTVPCSLCSWRKANRCKLVICLVPISRLQSFNYWGLRIIF